jgi:hypothetical protein
MYDGSVLPFDENAEETIRMVFGETGTRVLMR